uniref:Meiosis initiator n=1 Tax=Prolemur simus TaxID=1328070 RepID=A0A8C9B3C3_PROSS
PIGLGSSAEFNFGCPNQNQLLSPNRKQRKNHTSQLQELALLLPVALKTGNKKLTKKEILLHVLHYIQYLQRSIDVAKALLKFHTSAGEDGLGEGPHLNHTLVTFWQPPDPSDTQLSAPSERQTRTQKPRRSLALDKPEKLVTPDQKGGNMGGTAPPPRSPDSCSHHKAASSSSQGGRNGGQSHLTFLDMAESIVHCDILSWGHTAASSPGLCVCLLNSIPCRQKLLLYNSGEEVDKKSLDADPWLPVWTLQDSPHGSPLPLGPPKIDTWSVMGNPIEILGLSPSLFSSPGKLLPEQILEDGAEYLTEGEHPGPAAWSVQETHDPPDSHSLCQSLVSVDHCYLSLSENSKVPSSSSSEDSDTESMWTQQEDMCANPQGLQTSSDEDGDYTWTPTRRASTLSAAGRKARKGQAGRGPVKPKESKKASCPTQTKKKCVNGFIMFCRMNRKQYIRACPGTASTAATKELAQLWRVMTQQERRPYCIKARRFSRQHNRIVKQDNSSSDEDDDWEMPKPFYQLLAEKARCASDTASLPPPHHG